MGFAEEKQHSISFQVSVQGSMNGQSHFPFHQYCAITDRVKILKGSANLQICHKSMLL